MRLEHTRRQFLACLGLVTLPSHLLHAAPLPKDRLPPIPFTLTFEQNGKTVLVPLGEQVVVELQSERTQTGWEVNDIEGTSLKPIKVGGTIGDRKIPETEFEPYKKGKSEADPAVGTYRFRFRAVEEDFTYLTFRYIYPGGPVAEPRIATKCRGEFRIAVEVKRVR